LDDSVLVRFAKTLLPKWGGQFDENMGLLDLRLLPVGKSETRLRLSLERPEPRKTLYFLPAVEVKGTFAIGGAGVPRSRFEARGGIERRDDDVRDR